MIQSCLSSLRKISSVSSLVHIILSTWNLLLKQVSHWADSTVSKIEATHFLPKTQVEKHRIWIHWFSSFPHNLSFLKGIYWFLKSPVLWQQASKRKNHVVIINFAWDQLWPQFSFEMQLHEKQTALISFPLGLLGNKALFQIISSPWPRVISLGCRSC